MGYTTDFEGAFTITPPLSPERIAFLKAFNETRRMRRDETKVAALPDPVREAVGLPVGKEGGYFVGASGDFGQGHDASILDYNQEPSGQPGLWCQWAPSDDGTTLAWDGGEKFYSYQEWLEYLIAHFLKPWGHQLDGEVTWEGEESGDTGTISVTANAVSVFAD